MLKIARGVLCPARKVGAQVLGEVSVGDERAGERGWRKVRRDAGVQRGEVYEGIVAVLRVRLPHEGNARKARARKRVFAAQLRIYRCASTSRSM